MPVENFKNRAMRSYAKTGNDDIKKIYDNSSRLFYDCLEKYWNLLTDNLITTTKTRKKKEPSSHD